MEGTGSPNAVEVTDGSESLRDTGPGSAEDRSADTALPECGPIDVPPPSYQEAVQGFEMETMACREGPPRYSDLYLNVDEPCSAESGNGDPARTGSLSKRSIGLFFLLGFVTIMVVTVAGLTLSTALSVRTGR